MTGLERQELIVNGVRTVVYTAGAGDPVVFLHGAGTASGFDWTLPLAEDRRLVVPVHPGFGESDDDASISSVHDYVMHYLDLFEELGLEHFDLVGHSLGGWIASELAVEHSRMLQRLVLVSPVGLRVREAPAADLFRIPPEELLGMLTENPPPASGPPSLDLVVNSFRETASFARVAWERPYDPKLSRWLHRVSVPTLLLWGAKDKIVPAAQGEAWSKLIPGSRLEVVADRGHLILEEDPEPLRIVSRFLRG